METTKEQNKVLCEKYPFLIPTNRWSGKKITTKEPGFWPGSPDAIPEYDYEYTELDEMPDGWRIAFGEEMMDELKADLETVPNGIDNFRITQIKEKWGFLHFYCNGLTEHGWKIVSKYEELSKRICVICGKPATRVTTGWISPFCDDCVPKNERSVSIEEYMKKDEDED